MKSTSRRWLLPLAILAALALLGLTLWLGSATQPSAITPPAVPDAPDLPLGTITGERGEYVFVEDGRVMFLLYDRVRTGEDDLLIVTQPSIRIVFAPHRVMRIDADHAELVAPEGRLLNGQFTGNVVTSIYETVEGQQVDYDNREHIRLRVYLDDAGFDQQTGLLESDGPLHFTSPNIDLRGRGLNMTFNPLREQLQRLRVNEGHVLRLNPRREESAERAARGEDPETTAPDPPDEQARTRDRQAYLATFTDNVQVSVAGDQARLSGQKIDLLFMADPAMVQTPLSRQSGPRPTATPRQQDDVQAPAAAAQAMDEDPRSLTPVGDQDIIIRWQGPLEIAPSAAQADLLADGRDVLVGLEGAPARIVTSRDEVIEAGRMDYLLSSARIRALSSDAVGVMLDSPRLGIVTGRELVLYQAQASGTLLGPGTILAASRERHLPQSPKDLMIEWQDRLDLVFEVQDAPRGADAALDAWQPNRLTGIRLADFHGQVRIRHPQFRLDTHNLKLKLEAVTGREPQLRDIVAEGAVRLEAISDDPERQFQLNARSLQLTLKDDDAGQPIPDRMIAEGDVQAGRPGYRMTTDHLYTIFARDTADGDFEVQRVLAQGNVHVLAEQERTTLIGDRMVADVPRDRVELFGAPGRMARVEREDGVLLAAHLLMDQQGTSLQAIGAGEADMNMDPENPQARMTVQWQEVMHYLSNEQTLTFRGQVVTRTRDGADVSQLRAQELTLYFDQEDTGQSVRTAADGRQQLTSRRVRGGQARGKVVFEAQRLENDRAVTQLQLQGEKVNFENATRIIRVDEPGSLLVEDRRPATTAAGMETPTGVAITGRGATLFVWQDNMTLDAAHNNMVMRGGVQMVHEPLGGQAADQVKLICDVLLADMQETAGMGLWGQSGQEPQITQIMASGQVRLWQGRRQIFGDELLYTQPTQQVVITGSPQNPARVLPGDQPQALAAERIVWDLQRDRFDILRPGGTGLPVPGR